MFKCDIWTLLCSVKYQGQESSSRGVVGFLRGRDSEQVNIHWFNKLEFWWFYSSCHCLIVDGVVVIRPKSKSGMYQYVV